LHKILSLYRIAGSAGVVEVGSAVAVELSSLDPTAGNWRTVTSFSAVSSGTKAKSPGIYLQYHQKRRYCQEPLEAKLFRF